MVGAWSDVSGAFLMAVGVGAFLLLGLPLLFRPLLWASILRWNVPADDDLTVYFGRSLGAVLCVIGSVRL